MIALNDFRGTWRRPRPQMKDSATAKSRATRNRNPQCVRQAERSCGSLASSVHFFLRSRAASERLGWLSGLAENARTRDVSAGDALVSTRRPCRATPWPSAGSAKHGTLVRCPCDNVLAAIQKWRSRSAPAGGTTTAAPSRAASPPDKASIKRPSSGKARRILLELLKLIRVNVGNRKLERRSIHV